VEYGRRQAEEAEVTATAGGRGGELQYGRRQAEEAGVTADGRRTRGGGYGRRQAEEAEVTATAGGRGMRRSSLGSGYRCITHCWCSSKSSKSQDQLRPPRLRHVDEHATHGS
jgi:hypothetical protein